MHKKLVAICSKVSFLFLFLFSILISQNQIEAASGITIDIDKSHLTLNVNESTKLNATVTENQKVQWKTSNSSVIQVKEDSNQSGTLTAVGEGNATIIASIDGGESDFLEVSVKIPVTDLKLNKVKTELKVGQEETLEVRLTPSNPTNKKVRWVSSDNKIAVVDSNGKVTAKSVKGKETVIITAISLDDETKKAECEVTVVEVPVTGISFAQSQMEMVKGNTQTLIHTIIPSDASNYKVVWKSTNPAIATVDSNGKVNALAHGTTTIMATTVDGGYTATCTIVVKESAATKVILNKTTLTLYAGGATETLTAKVEPTNAGKQTITWTSDNPSVATVNRTTGLVTPISTGTAKITATNGESSASCTITVLSSSSNDARNLRIDRVTSSSVDLSWSGTTGRVDVELRKRSNDSYVKSSTSSSREITFSNLSSNTEYTVLIDGNRMGYFTTKRTSTYDDIYDVNIKRRSSSSVEITWRGTSGNVDVEVRRTSSSTVDSERTDDRRVTFSGLSRSTTYRLYIDDEYIKSFAINDLDSDSNRDIRSFKIRDIDESSVTAEWDSDDSYVEVEIRRSGRVIDSKRTSSERVRFTGLKPDTNYSIYIDGYFMDDFTTDDEDDWDRDYRDDRYWDDEKEVEKSTIRNFQVKKNYGLKSVEFTWSGTSGTVSASLRQSGITIDSKRTSTQKAVFNNIRPNQEYAVYIDNQFVGNISMGVFSDIENHWAKGTIESLYQYQIISGYEDGAFRPNNPLTREEYVTMLVKGMKLSTSSKKDSSFGDVASSRWSAPFISTAISKGILVSSDYPGGLFQPTKGITREEMAVMTARAMKLKSNPGALSFTDQSMIRNKGLVGALVDKKVISGYPNRTFQPLKTLTRAEGLSVIGKIYKS